MGILAKKFMRKEQPRGPKCSVHQVFMVYDAVTDTMRCPEDGCTKVRHRNIVFSSYNGEKEKPKPTVYRGGLELVIGDDDRLYLYLSDANVMVDVETWLHDKEVKD